MPSVNTLSPVPRPTAALPFIYITLLLDVLGFGLIIPVAPRLVERLMNADEAAAAPIVGLLGSTYALMQFLFAPTLGMLSDRVGRRPVLLLSTFGSGLDYFAMALAPTLPWLFVTRALNGLSGANMTAATAYIADVTAPKDRAKAFGMVGAVFGLGFVLGPLIGGLLGSSRTHIPLIGPGDIHYPFYAAGTITLLNWLYGYFVLPESHPIDRRRPIELARANPATALKRLAQFPFVARMAIAFFALHLAQFMLHATWVLYTKFRYGWDERAVGFSLFAVGIGAAVVQGGLARRLIPALGERRSLFVGLGFSCLAYLVYAFAPVGWVIYIGIGLGSLGGLAMPAAQSLVTRSIDPTQQGAVQGTLTSVQGLAQVIGPITGGAVLAWSIDGGDSTSLPGLVYAFSSVLALIGLAMAIWATATHVEGLAKSPNVDGSQT